MLAFLLNIMKAFDEAFEIREEMKKRYRYGMYE